MRWQRPIGAITFLLLAWAGWAAWQHHEYGHESDLARQTLAREAESVMKTLVGGLRSHRRLGFFQCDRLEQSLHELAESQDILAAAIVADEGRVVMTAGRANLLDLSPPVETGEFWDHAGFRCAVDFRVEQPSEGQSPGPGRGRGGGRGWGRAAKLAAEAGDFGPWESGGRFIAVLLLDRSQADEAIRRAHWIRTALALAGGVVLACVAVAWWTTVRLAAARGRARVLEAEARHLRDLGQAAAGLAHETRNPLGLIRGWTQRWTEGELPSAEQRRQARAIVEECDRLTARINQFLSFAKPCEPKPSRVDLGLLVDELGVLLAPDLAAKELRLEAAGGLSGWQVWADRELLRQALFNLISNAVHFAPPRGSVEILAAAGQNGTCRIEVADRGPGVPPEKIRSLFTPYFTTRSDGTGLGLAIVRRIAAGHDWRAGYDPRPGGGSVFWLDGIHGG